MFNDSIDRVNDVPNVKLCAATMGWMQLSVDTTQQPEWSIVLNTNIKPIGNSAVEERFIK